MNKSTPAKTKWTAKRQPIIAGETKFDIHNEEGYLIGEFFSFKNGKTNAKNNATLAVSAPELLAMVKAANHALYVVGSSKAMKDALRGSKVLIRKAEGEK